MAKNMTVGSHFSPLCTQNVCLFVCLFVKTKTSMCVFVTVFVKICLLLTNMCVCWELYNQSETHTEIRMFCLQSICSLTLLVQLNITSSKPCLGTNNLKCQFYLHQSGKFKCTLNLNNFGQNGQNWKNFVAIIKPARWGFFLISTFFDRVAGKIVSLPSNYSQNMVLLRHFLIRLTLTLDNFG